MARKKKSAASGGGEEGIPSWVLTYGDVVTLMLTFFVLLVSMSKVDETRRMVVLGSIFGTTGFLNRGYDVLSSRETRRSVDPGPLEDIKDFEPLKNMLWEPQSDIRFESNKVVQILSIGATSLFEPGSSRLSPEGEGILRAALPVLQAVPHPVLVAGHSGPLRDERAGDYHTEEEDVVPSPTWRISLDRALTVYRFLLEGGVSADKLSMEAFGSFRPRYNTADPKERALNRRVDLVLDLKNPIETQRLLTRTVEQAAQPRPVEAIEFQGFRFEVNSTAPEPWR